MPEIDEATLKKQLGGETLKRVYLIAGEEKLLVKRAAARLIDKAAGEAFPEFNRQEFGNGAPVDNIADAAQALPFFAQRKCVAVSDFNVEEKDSGELQKLAELLRLSPDSTTLVFWYPTLETDGKKSAKWRKFFQQVGQQGDLLFCGRRSAADLLRFLQREAEKAGCTLSRRNAERVLEYAGQDLTRLQNEMEKLCAYALGGVKARPAEITAESIELLVPKTAETTVFLLANALVAGNYEQAYRLLDLLFYQNEEPVAILGALSASYVDMYRVLAAIESGKSAQAAGEYGDYRGKEFRLRNAQRNARGLGQSVLRESLRLLLEADMALKGSRLEGRVILEELVAKLLLAAKGESA